MSAVRAPACSRSHRPPGHRPAGHRHGVRRPSGRSGPDVGVVRGQGVDDGRVDDLGRRDRPPARRDRDRRATLIGPYTSVAISEQEDSARRGARHVRVDPAAARRSRRWRCAHELGGAPRRRRRPRRRRCASRPGAATSTTLERRRRAARAPTPQGLRDAVEDRCREARPRRLPRRPHRHRRVRRHGRPRRQRRDRRPLPHEPGVGRARRRHRHRRLRRDGGRVAAVCGRPVFDLVRERLGPRFGARQPRRVVLHQPADAHRRDRRRRDRPLARRRASTTCCSSRSSPCSCGSSCGGCRSRRWSASSGCSACACSCSSSPCGSSGPTGAQLWSARRRPPRAGRRDALHLRLLRHRPVRRGDDAVRGVLLLRGRSRTAGRRGTSTRTGPTCSSASRSAGCCRWRSWRAPTSCSRRATSRRRAVAGGAAGRRDRSASSASPSALIGIFAATFGAALETSLSAGYIVAQYLGWPWGKHVQPREASRFHLVVLLAILAAVLIGLQRRRPGQGHRVLDRAVGRRAAAHLLPDPRHRQRPELHGRRAHQRSLPQRASPRVYLVILVARRRRHDPADDHHQGRVDDGRPGPPRRARPARPPAPRPRRASCAARSTTSSSSASDDGTWYVTAILTRARDTCCTACADARAGRGCPSSPTHIERSTARRSRPHPATSRISAIGVDRRPRRRRRRRRLLRRRAMGPRPHHRTHPRKRSRCTDQ